MPVLYCQCCQECWLIDRINYLIPLSLYDYLQMKWNIHEARFSEPKVKYKDKFFIRKVVLWFRDFFFNFCGSPAFSQWCVSDNFKICDETVWLFKRSRTLASTKVVFITLHQIGLAMWTNPYCFDLQKL